MTGLRRVPIGDYGLIGDTRTAALVAPDGAIDWWCLPRFDSPPVFGRVVGGDDAGSFETGPAEPARLERRRYRDGTATLETTWAVDGGQLTLADSMIAEVAGRLLPATTLVRRLASRGRPVEVAVRLSPRLGEGRARPARIRQHKGALVVEHQGLAMAVLTDGPERLDVDERVVFTVDPSRPLTIVVGVSDRTPLVFVPPALARAEAERDERGWRRWAEGIVTAPEHRATVVRSLLTLQLLTYSPSGAPVAAPTTSLPELLGGSRNWDYRYAWPRDASIGIAAFLTAGKDREARAFLAWLLHASRLARPRLPALLTLHGRPGPAERELHDWPGYAESRPVRTGNGAADQHQLDGYGWVLDAAWLLTRAGHRLDGETWRAMRAFADHVAATWHLPDAGIWERRDKPRHHVHSKLMAWLALDRAVRIALERGGRAARRAPGWEAARDRVAADVRANGFDPRLGAYTAAYGTSELDAAVLFLPILGIEPAGSARVAGTVDAIRERLGAGGPLIYRYLEDDGLPGREGAFLPCSFWLVQALSGIGRRAEAREMFDELVALGGPLGLFAEEMDPRSGEQLGNFPQALTHASLLQAAAALDTVAPRSSEVSGRELPPPIIEGRRAARTDER
ncbi:MAG: glycoside hydrolase family 15 protein [Acidimicrobiia bacterium]|nr:glycoside hydrolase family 15 protein [Acidimicrobiia bacterium]